MEFLPKTEREIEKLPRAYIANVCYTVAGEDFKTWTNEKIAARNQKIVEDQDLAIHMHPSLAAIFRNSSSVSTSKGISSHLMKAKA